MKITNNNSLFQTDQLNVQLVFFGVAFVAGNGGVTDNELRDLEWKVEDFQARYISDLNNPSQDSQAYELMKWEWQDLLKKVTILETNQLETWELDDIKNRIAYLEAQMHGH